MSLGEKGGRGSIQRIVVNYSANLRILKEIVKGSKLPVDDYDHHDFLAPKQLNRQCLGRESFDALVDQFVHQSNTKRRGLGQLEQFRLHWDYILLNLSQSIFRKHWLSISLDNNAYGPKGDYWLRKYAFSLTAIKDIVSYLEANDLIHKKTGKLYKNDPARTRIFPKPVLEEMLWHYFLDIEQPIKPPYVTINEGRSGWNTTVKGLKKDHPDRKDLKAINNFLKGHHWACKAPVRLVYNQTALQGGRLITPFQGLPDRTYRVRINTLIDGEPIAEVDFNANHLRLNLAVVSRENAGDTPYEDIGEVAGVEDRDSIKKVITVAMGASNEGEARSSLSRKGLGKVLVDKIIAGTQKRYPKLQLFTGWGLSAQNLEGQILKEVMLRGIEKDIVCLPVHDAVAVTQGNAEWARETMLQVWAEQTGGGRTKVKVDMP
ncbi:hypothetical protein BOW37_12525 [Solemya velum gill symbiont]|nr:hypothetical protein BOW37_12525 [Solemya velum gill symbiont]OOZ47039.1 hypothetical protein BOW38_04250 [Solemya velum gill symbiont]OOZ52139.1 hypothetical protein BOW40_03575 [Solemya velum gill symbiont]OOZ54996.1 hypothetical protein BOW41_04810 [Solemya velum gill symbiont]OOZ56655.1 hypothetical protein BOW42_06035 [Solemya velum gill symbiont]